MRALLLMLASVGQEGITASFLTSSNAEEWRKLANGGRRAAPGFANLVHFDPLYDHRAMCAVV